MRRFDKRTVIVTGGAGGMGASPARGVVAFATMVWMWWRSRQTLRGGPRTL